MAVSSGKSMRNSSSSNETHSSRIVGFITIYHSPMEPPPGVRPGPVQSSISNRRLPACCFLLGPREDRVRRAPARTLSGRVRAVHSEWTRGGEGEPDPGRREAVPWDRYICEGVVWRHCFYTGNSRLPPFFGRGATDWTAGQGIRPRVRGASGDGDYDDHHFLRCLFRGRGHPRISGHGRPPRTARPCGRYGDCPARGRSRRGVWMRCPTSRSPW